MQAALFRKFLGKAPPLEQVKLGLSYLWRNFGSLSVAEMPNGFFFIQCESVEMQSK